MGLVVINFIMFIKLLVNNLIWVLIDCGSFLVYILVWELLIDFGDFVFNMVVGVLEEIWKEDELNKSKKIVYVEFKILEIIRGEI